MDKNIFLGKKILREGSEVGENFSHILCKLNGQTNLKYRGKNLTLTAHQK
jgi:hypothetical protein